MFQDVYFIFFWVESKITHPFSVDFCLSAPYFLNPWYYITFRKRSLAQSGWIPGCLGQKRFLSYIHVLGSVVKFLAANIRRIYSLTSAFPKTYGFLMIYGGNRIWLILFNSLIITKFGNNHFNHRTKNIIDL